MQLTRCPSRTPLAFEAGSCLAGRTARGVAARRGASFASCELVARDVRQSASACRRRCHEGDRPVLTWPVSADAGCRLLVPQDDVVIDVRPGVTDPPFVLLAPEFDGQRAIGPWLVELAAKCVRNVRCRCTSTRQPSRRWCVGGVGADRARSLSAGRCCGRRSRAFACVEARTCSRPRTGVQLTHGVRVRGVRVHACNDRRRWRSSPALMAAGVEVRSRRARHALQSTCYHTNRHGRRTAHRDGLLPTESSPT